MSITTRTPFQQAYIEAALWSSTDESTDAGGDPLDENYGSHNIESESLAQMLVEAAAFDTLYGHHWENGLDPSGAQAGHDFWLTRNRHGTGFWDRSDEYYSKSSRDILTQASEAAGEQHLSVDGDGEIHVSRG